MNTASIARRATSLALAACALAIAACASRAPRAATPNDPAETASTSRGRANVLTQEDIRRANITNVFDLVSTLRPRWMQTRGQDSFQRPSEVQVYVDNTRLTAGLNGLRDLASIGVSRIEFVGPIDASARWGLDHGQGAIVVTTSTR